MRTDATPWARPLDVAMWCLTERALQGLMAAVVAVVVVLGMVAPPRPAGAAAPAAIIAVPGSASTPLVAGGSATPFTVDLPLGSACPGDTAHDGNHVYSFLVHQGTNIAALTFESSPSSGFGLFDATGDYYGPVNTALGTGEIIQIPNNFEWAPLVTSGGGSVSLSQLLYQGGSGAWEVGLACANTHGTENASWSAPITFSASATDPHGFVWTVDEPGPVAAPTKTRAGTAAPIPTTAPSSGADSALAAGAQAPVPVAHATTGASSTTSAAAHDGSGTQNHAEHPSPAIGSTAAVADSSRSGWMVPVALAILAVALGVGIVWLARRQRAKKPINTESAQ